MHPNQYVDRSGWSDAAIAAEAASLALQEGRYQLGFAFSRIAFEANRAQRRQAIQPAAPGVDLQWKSGETDLSTRVFDEVAQQAKTDLFGNPEDVRPLQVPESARCIALTATEGVQGECHGVIAYDADGRHTGVPGWYHLHPTDHDAIPPAGLEQG